MGTLSCGKIETYHVDIACAYTVVIFQELNSKAEGKFNRLKTQAKTKIAALNKELEKLREEHGAPPLNISAQVSGVVLYSI